MTIDEAIKVQRRVLGKLASDNYLKADEYQSFQLGIEALEAIKAGREWGFLNSTDRLPSEEEPCQK